MDKRERNLRLTTSGMKFKLIPLAVSSRESQYRQRDSQKDNKVIIFGFRFVLLTYETLKNLPPIYKRTNKVS